MLGLHAQAQDIYTLKEALRTAKINNPALQTEQFKIGIAETDIITAKLSLNPSFDNETLFITRRSEFPENTNWYNAHNREVLWQVSKPFQIAGQRKNKIDLANKYFEWEKKNYSETERNVFSEVAEKWLEVWTTQKQLDILQIAINNIDSLVLTNEVRYRNQVITATDLSRTKLLAKQYAIQYKTARQEIINNENELKFLLGVQGNISIDTADNFIFAVPANMDSLLQQSLQNRSDLQSAKSFSEASNSNIKLQKSLAYPQPELGVIWNPQSTVPFFGISASIDLPFFDRNQGEIRKSYLEKHQADQHLFVLQTQIQKEIKVAFANFQLQQQNIQDYDALLEQSQTILDNVKYAYLKGGTTIIDFLEAQRSWLETQQQYYETLEQFRRGYIQLLYTTGLINQLAQ